jgi:hypothetical protein
MFVWGLVVEQLSLCSEHHVDTAAAAAPQHLLAVLVLAS